MAYDQHADYQHPTRQYMNQGPQHPVSHSQRPPSDPNRAYNGYHGNGQGQDGYGYDEYGYQQEYGQQGYGNGGGHQAAQQSYQQDDFGYGDLIGQYEESPPPNQSYQAPPPRGSSRGALPRPERSYTHDDGYRSQGHGYEQPIDQGRGRRPPPGPRHYSSGGRQPPMGRPQGYPPHPQSGHNGRHPNQRPDSRDQTGQGRYNRPPPHADGRSRGEPQGNRPPTRERIQQKQAPIALSQDDAFPSFPTSKPAPTSNGTELEASMANMNLQGGRKSEDRNRPPTSSSHRSKTSHSSGQPQKPNGFHDSGYQESFETPFGNQRPGYGSKHSFNSVPSFDGSQNAHLSPQRKSPPRLPPLRLGSGQLDRTSGGPLSPSHQSFGSVQRSVTMPIQPPSDDSRSSMPQEQWTQTRASTEAFGLPSPAFPPARPSTAGGYAQSQTKPVQTEPQVYKAFTSPKYQEENPLEKAHKRDESLSDLYDDYYDESDPQKHGRMGSKESAIDEDMPNFDAIPAQSPRFTLHFNSPPFKAAASPSFPDPSENPNVSNGDFYKQAKMSRSQPDLRSHAQTGSHMYDDRSSIPQMPPLNRNNMTPGPRGRGMTPPGVAGGYGQSPGPGYGMHDRTMAPPLNRNITDQSQWSDPGPGARPSIDSQRPSLQIDQARHSNPDALPQHPTPVRAGLMESYNNNPNTPQGYQGSNRPPPVRQYNNDSHTSTASDRHSSRASLDRQSMAPVTHDELNRLRSIVRTSPNDRKSQLLLAKKLVEAARVLADEGGTADMRTRNKNREKFITEAYKNAKKLVSLGYPEGLFYMADCYGQGSLGLEVDPKEAFNLYQQAAKMGHAQAAYRTAVCCEMGSEEGGGTRRDPQKAVQWYKRAATLGDVAAMYKAGMISLRGLLGQSKNIGEAVNWLKRAAERADEENPHALHELGLLYEGAATNTTGPILRDENYAFQLFKEAADLGYKFSQFRLGQAFEYGQLNLPIDARNSIAWYTRAAAQGEHQSELALSGWYLTGCDGILEQSDTEAYLWARKASTAEPPLAKSMFAMGRYTEMGIGCPRSLEEAKKWYGRAAAYKHPGAQERLEELKKGGMKALKSRERLQRGNQKHQDENCVVM